MLWLCAHERRMGIDEVAQGKLNGKGGGNPFHHASCIYFEFTDLHSPPHLSSHIYCTRLDCLLDHLVDWWIIQTPEERVKETLWTLETTKVI